MRPPPLGPTPADEAGAEPTELMVQQLVIHTFGGFEIRRNDQRLDELESRKVEALGAYLVANRRRSFAREHLASLLWPERSDTSARRNLRQALYNLRSTLARDGVDRFVVDGRSVRFEPHAEDWIDLDPFERALLPEAGDTAADSRELAAAVRLYRGEFLAGLAIPGLELEEWLLGEQERYRDAVLRALRDLVEHSLTTGDHELGIRYARRLVRIDPLSEEAHRKLIRLYALTGRRGRALAQYEELADLLARELDVEPLQETDALVRAIREGEAPTTDLPAAPEPTGPVLPLVGRNEALEAFESPWRQVVKGRGRLTLLEGAEGVGKTRLVKTFLHRAATGSGATVLQGAWFELEPPVPYRGLRQALNALLDHELDALDRLFAESSAEDLARLSRLVPRFGATEGGLPHPPAAGWTPPTGPPEPVAGDELAASLARTLASIARPATEADAPPAPVILLLEDLHWADGASLDLLAHFAAKIDDLPIWILATTRPGSEAVRLLADLPQADTIALGPLALEALRRLAAELVAPAEVDDLAELLAARTGGNALMASMLVNLLWDRGVLEPVEDGGWHLRVRGTDLWEPEVAGGGDADGETVDEIVARRLSLLPPSARRLLTLAAVAGPRFEPELLGEIEGEEEIVIEASLRTLLERWLVRLSLGYWADSRRDRDMVLWTGGARLGTFEFAHGAVRRAVYRMLGPERRRALHRKVAEALEAAPGSPDEPPYQVPPEVVAHHHLEGGAPERAAPLLLEAAERAELLDARAEAVYARDLAARSAERAAAARTASVHPPRTAPKE